MRIQSIGVLILLSLLISAGSPVFAETGHENAQSATSGTATGHPIAVIEDNQLEFDPVLDGAEVVHTFVVENTGTAPLIIDKIKTGCGCTTADYTKTVAPGEKGNITLKASTKGYGGRMFNRHVQVFTNDPENKVMNIVMTGKVDKFAGIVPSSAVLKGKADEPVETMVSLIPDKKYPFQVTGTQMDNFLEDKIEYKLETSDNGCVVLRVKNLFHEKGQYRGYIRLQTDNPQKPEIQIRVIGNIS